MSFSVRHESGAVPGPDTLLCVDFGGAAADGDPRHVQVGLQPLDGAGLGEHWRSRLPVRCGREDGIGWSENGEVLFLQLRIGPAALDDMELAAFEAYSRISAFTRARGYPHLLRTWNYFDDIHRGEGDRERYRQFVSGRYRALAGDPAFEQRLPAATAIGTRVPGMLIYLLAARRPGRPVENPRQLSAWRYPAQYGPRSPSFARAMRVDADDGAQLLVSGTASIVGHASQHPGDAPAQLGEILRNLDALLAAAPAAGRWQAESLKLYLRDPQLLPALQPLLRARFGADALCYEGDICRSDLLVEIEGVFSEVSSR